MGPDEFCIANGAKYVFRIDRGGLNRSGKIFDERGDVCWQYDVRRNPEGRTLRNPLNKPDFVFMDAPGQAELVIRRISLIPSRFQILDGSDSIGQITLRSLLGIKYAIKIDGFAPYTFRLPMFTLCFWGDMGTGPSIWVMVGPSKMQWNVLLKPGTNDRELVLALAFIHNQWWNYS
jgi:hypothetical protein